jgi:hypothetical protein
MKVNFIVIILFLFQRQFVEGHYIQASTYYSIGLWIVADCVPSGNHYNYESKCCHNHFIFFVDNMVKATSSKPLNTIPFNSDCVLKGN